VAGRQAGCGTDVGQVASDALQWRCRRHEQRFCYFLRRPSHGLQGILTGRHNTTSSSALASHAQDNRSNISDRPK